MKDLGFVVTLQRGAEWAATGRVTQQVPPDFSMENESRAPMPVQASESGKLLFQQKCGFCHGTDGSGGEGPDLLHSSLVLHDEDGNLIGPVARSGLADQGMPAFQLSDAQTKDIAAFLHAEIKADATIFYTDSTSNYSLKLLLVGNADAGRAYFEGPGKCNQCHSPTGDLAHVASRYKPIDLQTRIAYPAGTVPTITVTLGDGTRIKGKQVRVDPFFVSLCDSDGWTHTWPRNDVVLEIQDPLSAHRAMLRTYTDEQIHNLFAYLETLK